MKTIIGVESFEEMRERKQERARKIVAREHVPSERRISFETAEDMLACLTPARIRLCEAARQQPRSVSELAVTLGRPRRAVHRDVKALHGFGMLKLRKAINPGHGQLQLVEATAERFHLVAEV